MNQPQVTGETNAASGSEVDPELFWWGTEKPPAQPKMRVRSPREMRCRRRPGWMDYRFVLPKSVYERLRKLTIAMAEWQTSGRPRTKNRFVVEALEDFLQKHGL